MSDQIKYLNKKEEISSFNQNLKSNLRKIKEFINGKECTCAKETLGKDYPADIETEIPFELRANDPYTPMPEHVPNGGLYGGPHSTAWYIPQPAPPTTTYFTQVLLKKANPPPGATEQYPHNNRHGNNYTPMPGISWYNSPYPRNSGPFYFKVINEKKK